MNKSSFFGKDLWIQYAPEYESLEDTQRKLNGRRFAVRQRLEELVVERPDETIHEYQEEAASIGVGDDDERSDGNGRSASCRRLHRAAASSVLCSADGEGDGS